MEMAIIWVLNVLLRNFNLSVNETGLYYIIKENKREYLVSKNFEDALRFLGIRYSYSDLRKMSYSNFIDTIKKSTYFNKGLFIDPKLSKTQRDNMRIRCFYKSIRVNYETTKSNYKFTKCKDLYQRVIFERFGNFMSDKITSKELREDLIKSKINSKIILDNNLASNIKQAQNIYDAFARYKTDTDFCIFEQYVIHNSQEDIDKQLREFIEKKMYAL